MQRESCGWTNDLDNPQKYRSTVVNFLKKHGDLFASKDS